MNRYITETYDIHTLCTYIERRAKAREKEREQKRLTAERRRKLSHREDLDDLEEDYKNLKRLKRKKISEKEFFNRTTGQVDSDSDELMETVAEENSDGFGTDAD